MTRLYDEDRVRTLFSSKDFDPNELSSFVAASYIVEEHAGLKEKDENGVCGITKLVQCVLDERGCIKKPLKGAIAFSVLKKLKSWSYEGLEGRAVAIDALYDEHRKTMEAYMDIRGAIGGMDVYTDCRRNESHNKFFAVLKQRPMIFGVLQEEARSFSVYRDYFVRARELISKLRDLERELMFGDTAEAEFLPFSTLQGCIYCPHISGLTIPCPTFSAFNHRDVTRIVQDKWLDFCRVFCRIELALTLAQQHVAEYFVIFIKLRLPAMVCIQILSTSLPYIGEAFSESQQYKIFTKTQGVMNNLGSV